MRRISSGGPQRVLVRDEEATSLSPQPTKVLSPVPSIASNAAGKENQQDFLQSPLVKKRTSFLGGPIRVRTPSKLVHEGKDSLMEIVEGEGNGTTHGPFTHHNSATVFSSVETTTTNQPGPFTYHNPMTTVFSSSENTNKLLEKLCKSNNSRRSSVGSVDSDKDRFGFLSARNSVTEDDVRQQQESRPWLLDDFSLGKPLGKGKFGNVYLAKQKKTNAPCALKVLFKGQMQASNTVSMLRRYVLTH